MALSSGAEGYDQYLKAKGEGEGLTRVDKGVRR